MTTLFQSTTEPPTTQPDADFEPGEQWKSHLKADIENGLRYRVDEAKQKINDALKGVLVTAVERERLTEEYCATMKDIRNLAKEQFRIVLERERQERRWAAQALDQELSDSVIKEQQAILDKIERERNNKAAQPLSSSQPIADHSESRSSRSPERGYWTPQGHTEHEHEAGYFPRLPNKEPEEDHVPPPRDTGKARAGSVSSGVGSYKPPSTLDTTDRGFERLKPSPTIDELDDMPRSARSATGAQDSIRRGSLRRKASISTRQLPEFWLPSITPEQDAQMSRTFSMARRGNTASNTSSYRAPSVLNTPFSSEPHDIMPTSAMERERARISAVDQEWSSIERAKDRERTTSHTYAEARASVAPSDSPISTVPIAYSRPSDSPVSAAPIGYTRSSDSSSPHAPPPSASRPIATKKSFTFDDGGFQSSPSPKGWTGPSRSPYETRYETSRSTQTPEEVPRSWQSSRDMRYGYSAGEAKLKEDELRRKEEETKRKEEETRRKEDEIRRKEVEATRRQEEADRKELEIQIKEEEARKKEEETKRKEDEIRRKEMNARKKEEEVRRKEAQAKKRAEDLRRQEQEAKRKEDEVRRKEEEVRLKEEAARAKEEEIRRKEAELAQRAEELLRLEAEAVQQQQVRKREEEIRNQHVEAQAKKRAEDLRRQEEDVAVAQDTLRLSEEAKHREDEVRRNEEASLQKEAAHAKEEIQRKEEELARWEEALAQREEALAQREEELGSPEDLTNELQGRSQYPITSGGFGDIWKCDLVKPNEIIQVAVKTIRAFEWDNEELTRKNGKRVRRELKVWGRLKHHSILPLWGVANDFGPHPAMICPWAANGALTGFLERQQDKLSSQDKFSLLNDIALGLQYLHSKSVVHGDLTGSNVLIYGNGRACLADFGLSTIILEFIGTSYFTSSIRGNIRWVAAELFDAPEGYEISLSTECDIYSFGSIILQVLTCKVPYYSVKRDIAVLGQVIKGIKPEPPKESRISPGHWEFIQ